MNKPFKIIRHYYRSYFLFFKSLVTDLPHELYKIATAVLSLIIIGGIIVHFIEADANPLYSTIEDSIYWAVVTISTTGYGDIVPKTTIGRVAAGTMMLFGIVIMSLFTASISSILVSRKIQTQRGLMNIYVKNHIVICGYFPTIRNVIQSLYKQDSHAVLVLINDYEQDTIDLLLSEFSKNNLHFVRGNFSNEVFLEKAKIKDAQSVIILPDISHDKVNSKFDEMTLMTVLTLKQIAPNAKIFTHVVDKELIPHLKRAGIDGYIISDEISGELIANFIISPGATQAVKQMVSLNASQNLKVMDIPGFYVGKTYQDLLTEFKANQNVLVMGFISKEEPIDLNALLSNDMSAIDVFIQKKFKEAGIGAEKSDQVQVTINPALSYVIQANELALVLGA
ncbi:MAG: NAD-binding protein [Bacteroidetes bacterium]|nr:NAD-binding protein [Bacteroidota bacterium]